MFSAALWEAAWGRVASNFDKQSVHVKGRLRDKTYVFVFESWYLLVKFDDKSAKSAEQTWTWKETLRLFALEPVDVCLLSASNAEHEGWAELEYTEAPEVEGKDWSQSSLKIFENLWNKS